VFFVFFVVKSCVRQRGRQIAAAQTRKTELKPQMHADASRPSSPAPQCWERRTSGCEERLHLRFQFCLAGLRGGDLPAALAHARFNDEEHKEHEE